MNQHSPRAGNRSYHAPQRSFTQLSSSLYQNSMTSSLAGSYYDKVKETPYKMFESTTVAPSDRTASRSLSFSSPNQLVPGLRFGRFFGDIEDATERSIKKEISNQEEGVDEKEVMRRIVRRVSGREEIIPSEQILLKKIEKLQSTVEKLSCQNQELEQQNKSLKQNVRVLKNSSMAGDKKNEWLTKYCKERDHDVKQLMSSQYKLKVLLAQSCKNSNNKKNSL